MAESRHHHRSEADHQGAARRRREGHQARVDASSTISAPIRSAWSSWCSPSKRRSRSTSRTRTPRRSAPCRTPSTTSRSTPRSRRRRAGRSRAPRPRGVVAMERVVITGSVSSRPTASARGDVAGVLAGETGIGADHALRRTAFSHAHRRRGEGLRARRAGSPKKKIKEMGRFAEFARRRGGSGHRATRKLELSDAERDTCGCFIGVGIGGLDHPREDQRDAHDQGADARSARTSSRRHRQPRRRPGGDGASLRGPSYCTTSACSSGAHAIGEAFEWIRRGRATSWSPAAPRRPSPPVGIGGFERDVRALAPQRRSRRARAALGQGARRLRVRRGRAASWCSSRSPARRSAAREIYAEVMGYGASCDAYHITKPAPDGEGAQRAMRMALEDAQLDAGRHRLRERARHLDAARRHRGVARHRHDVRRRTRSTKKLWVSSTKSMMGHLLGARRRGRGGASARSPSRDGRVPPTINLDDPGSRVPARLRAANAARERRRPARDDQLVRLRRTNVRARCSSRFDGLTSGSQAGGRCYRARP